MLKIVKVSNLSRDTVLGDKIRMAETFTDRTIGLITTPELRRGEGLWLKSCASVHTFFMRFPIDILFIDAGNKILAIQTLAPWRVSYWFSKSQGVLELPAGTAARTETIVGDLLEFKPLPTGRPV